MRPSIAALLLGMLISLDRVHSDDWPQWRGPSRDGVWRETGIVAKLPAKLTFKWREKIGAGYAGPAVADGRVYVTDRVLNRGVKNPNDPFDRSAVQGIEQILCLDEKTGKLIWKHRYPSTYTISYPAGPRTTPTVHQGKVYALGAMGELHCLNADNGQVFWSKNFMDDFGAKMNTWGSSAAPLIDGRNLILLVGGAKDACVMALDKDSGEEVWRALFASDPGYASPVIFENSETRQLMVWNPDGLYSLNPETGKVYWQQPFRVKSGMSIATPIFDAQRKLVFVTAFYSGPMMMKVAPGPTASLLWKGKSDSEIRTDGLHAVMCTPFFQDGYIYGVCSYGQLRCLNAMTGKRLWESIEATGRGRWWNAFLIKHHDRYFICNEQGELIIAKLSPKGYEEVSRSFLIEPTNKALRRNVIWSHPAFANRHIYARNDQEIVCVDLSENSHARTESSHSQLAQYSRTERR